MRPRCLASSTHCCFCILFSISFYFVNSQYSSCACSFSNISLNSHNYLTHHSICCMVECPHFMFSFTCPTTFPQIKTKFITQSVTHHSEALLNCCGPSFTFVMVKTNTSIMHPCEGRCSWTPTSNMSSTRTRVRRRQGAREEQGML